MRFAKLHGLGNDYVFVDAARAAEPRCGWAQLSREVSDRRRGVGADGLILLCPARVAGADLRMRIFNADGSEAQMCGNGVRCLVKFAIEHAGFKPGPVVVVEVGTDQRRTVSVTPRRDGAGVVMAATVDMGSVRVGGDADGFDRTRARPCGVATWCVQIEGVRVEFTPASVGNPHAVVINSPGFDLDTMGPLMERHPAFPERTNVHAAEVVTRGHLRMRNWERGSGLTLACGTGACAVAAVAHATGAADAGVRVSLPGGDLEIEQNAAGHALMTGPAEEAFTGEWRDC